MTPRAYVLSRCSVPSEPTTSTLPRPGVPCAPSQHKLNDGSLTAATSPATFPATTVRRNGASHSIVDADDVWTSVNAERLHLRVGQPQASLAPTAVWDLHGIVVGVEDVLMTSSSQENAATITAAPLSYSSSALASGGAASGIASRAIASGYQLAPAIAPGQAISVVGVPGSGQCGHSLLSLFLSTVPAQVDLGGTRCVMLYFFKR